MRFRIIFGLTLVVAMSTACASAAPHRVVATAFEIEGPKESIVEGGIFKVTVKPSVTLTDIVAEFQGQVIEFYADKNAQGQPTNSYSAWIGVEYGSKPEKLPVKVRARSGDRFVESEIKVEVKSGVYPSETLSVAPRTVTPTKKDQIQIAKDRELLGRIYSVKTKAVFWDPPAQIPIQSEITSVYGSSRVYNGIKQNVHLGTDLRAKVGTKIFVPLAGRVVVSRNLFYTGKTVILDHGYGFFSIYGHLSRLKLKEGTVAKKGQFMGLSGDTGRVSGPHLHWGVQLHGVKIDPMVMMQALR